MYLFVLRGFRVRLFSFFQAHFWRTAFGWNNERNVALIKHRTKVPFLEKGLPSAKQNELETYSSKEILTKKNNRAAR